MHIGLTDGGVSLNLYSHLSKVSKIVLDATDENIPTIKETRPNLTFDVTPSQVKQFKNGIIAKKKSVDEKILKNEEKTNDKLNTEQRNLKIYNENGRATGLVINQGAKINVIA